MAELNMISAHHNYDEGYIGLVNLQLGDLPPALSVKGYDLIVKSEFHISLVCVKKLAPLIDPTRIAEIKAEIVEVFKEFIKHNPLSSYEITDRFRLVRRDDRVALVVLARVPGIEDFFAQLEKKYNKKLPVQVTHITLYTLQPERAIGILSDEELARDSEVVEVSLPLLSR